MSAKSFFGGFFSSSRATESNLVAPFELKISRGDFCDLKIENLFKKILQRCYARSQGAEDENKIRSLFDSTEKSGARRGLISLVAWAMTEKKQIGLVYNEGVVRLATSSELSVMKKDYDERAKSSVGVIVDFTKYNITDLIRVYMLMIYDILGSMNTQVGLAKALQIKVASLRGTVSAVGKEEPINQAKDINESLKAGNSVMLDKNDEVELLELKSQSIKDAITLVNSQLATELGMPLSFINGELTTGMSATGEADANAEEYGLQDFFNSIFKPICDNLYGWNLQFVSDDWRYFSSMIGSLIIVENSSLLSDEQRQAFVDRLLPVSKK